MFSIAFVYPFVSEIMQKLDFGSNPHIHQQYGKVRVTVRWWPQT